jgi:hypothetical protein
MTFDGIVYYDDSSTVIPTAADMLPLVDDALNEDAVLPALQKHFASVSEFSLEQLFTLEPTGAPTLSPENAQPVISPSHTTTATPTPVTGLPSSLPSYTPTTLAPVFTSTPTKNPTTLSTETGRATTMPNVSPPIAGPSMGSSTDPTLAPVRADYVATTPAPQSIAGVSREVDAALNNESGGVGTVAGSAAGAFLVLVIIAMLNSRRRRRGRESWVARMDEDSVQEEDFGDDLEVEEDKGSPARTHAISSADEDDEVISSHQVNDEHPKEQPQDAKKTGASWISLFRAKDPEPPNLAMTDGSGNEEEDFEESTSHPGTDNTSLIDQSPGIVPRGRSPATLPDSLSGGGQSVSGQSVESFEFERRQQQSYLIRKDLLESSDFPTNAIRDAKTRQAWVQEERYDCALAPTDISASALAKSQHAVPCQSTRDLENAGSLLTLEEEDDDDNTAETPMTFEEPAFHEDLQHETKRLTTNMSNYLASFLGPKQSERRPQRSPRRPEELVGDDSISAGADDDTFDNVGEWDPDDDEQSGSLTDPFDGLNKGGSIDEQSFFENRERSNETYQLQPLRAPPEAPMRGKPEEPSGARLGIVPRQLFSAPEDASQGEQSV